MAGSGSRRSQRRYAPSLSDDEINGHFRDKLRDYNSRDADTIRRHINTLRDALQLNENDVVRTRFGGSTSRNTFVRGLSDSDVLAIINDSSLSGRRPSEVIQYMAELIKQRLPRTRVVTGDLAVTVTFSDGNEIQFLPSVRTRSGVRIADAGQNRWSDVVHPERFARKLTQVNQANEGRVVPTVKLAKGMAARMIRSDKDRPSGYHIESLAIDAFKGYRGPRDLKSMLMHFTKYSSKAVLQPMRDATGQSRHVDGNLGRQGSAARRNAAAAFENMHAKLQSCRTERELDGLLD